MDLAIVEKECIKAFNNKWFEFNASKLCVNFALYSCEELKLSTKIKASISTDDLAFLISTNVLTDWKGLKDVNGNDVPFTSLNAFNALSNDLEFLKLVSELSLDRSNFA